MKKQLQGIAIILVSILLMLGSPGIYGGIKYIVPWCGLSLNSE